MKEFNLFICNARTEPFNFIPSIFLYVCYSLCINTFFFSFTYNRGFDHVIIDSIFFCLSNWNAYSIFNSTVTFFPKLS